jgi:hypothetical protein
LRFFVMQLNAKMQTTASDSSPHVMMIRFMSRSSKWIGLKICFPNIYYDVRKLKNLR